MSAEEPPLGSKFKDGDEVRYKERLRITVYRVVGVKKTDDGFVYDLEREDDTAADPRVTSVPEDDLKLA